MDATTGSFSGFDDMKPKVIRVDFEELPEKGPARAKAIMENGGFWEEVLVRGRC